MKNRAHSAVHPFSPSRTIVLSGLFIFLMVWSIAGIDISSWLSGSFSSGYTGSEPAVDGFLLVMVAIMFILIHLNFVNRTLIVLAFAVKILLVGMFTGFYSLTDAFLAIKFDTLSLLLGMGLISTALDESGLFLVIAGWLEKIGAGSGRRILVFCCLLTYSFSLVANNLATIMVIVPMTLRMAERMGFDPRPLIIGVIISANLGGASTMVGDFPNMLIASQSGLSFNSFIATMMPACLVMLAILLLFLTSGRGIKLGNAAKGDNFKHMPGQTAEQARAAERILWVLAIVVFLLVFAEKFSLPPATIALVGGFASLLCCGSLSGRVIARLGYGDVLFFTGLFIVVGALDGSGILHYFSDAVLAASSGHPLAVCLLLMWLSAFVTAFLNAGPSTAFFIPIIVGLGGTVSGQLVWWSLSLGVLAGSSATIFGATAGPVSASLVEAYQQTGKFGRRSGQTLSADYFFKTGLPIALLFLAFSSFYIFLIYHKI